VCDFDYLNVGWPFERMEWSEGEYWSRMRVIFELPSVGRSLEWGGEELSRMTLRQQLKPLDVSFSFSEPNYQLLTAYPSTSLFPTTQRMGPAQIFDGTSILVQSSSQSDLLLTGETSRVESSLSTFYNLLYLLHERIIHQIEFERRCRFVMSVCRRCGRFDRV